MTCRSCAERREAIRNIVRQSANGAQVRVNVVAIGRSLARDAAAITKAVSNRMKVGR